MTSSEFDQYASNYEAALEKGIGVSGESAEYFAIHRVRWLRRRLGQLGASRLNQAMDFGCGTGNSVEFLLSELGCSHVVGIDTSEQSLVQARQRYSADCTRFQRVDEYQPDASLELVYCNGVFHHIPVEARDGAVEFIFKSLKSGGWFAYWENNPWNPGTRIVMSRIPFDRDAVTLTIPESKRMLEKAGFKTARVDTTFYFPKLLKWLRFAEPALAWLPLGAQYLVLAQKP